MMSAVKRTPKPKPAAHAATLDLSITAHSGTAYAGYIRRHLMSAHAELRPALTELSLALVGDKRMSDLHLQFLHLPGPTDVLTFPMDADRRGRILSGEVVVCVPEAKRRAAREGHDVRRELLLYALHGMLHLCGFDDTTDSGFATMHRTEDMILTKIGVGPVFAAPERGSRKAAARPRSSGRLTAGPDRTPRQRRSSPGAA